MDEHRRIYDSFLRTQRVQGLPRVREPTAFLHFYKGALPTPDEALIAVTMHDIQTSPRFDKESELTRWLLRQLSTYDYDRQAVVGMVFDPKIILSDVLQVPRPSGRSPS